MRFEHSLARLAAAALLCTAGASAHAFEYADVNLAGWQSFGSFLAAQNSGTYVNLGIGATVTGFEYQGLTFSTSGSSWLSELVLTVNYHPYNENIAGFLDHAPGTQDSGGTFGPASGSWGVGGGFNDGAGFVVGPTGQVWVTVYELFNDAGLDATISAGTLRIQYTPAGPITAVPEPASLALMTLGVGVLGAALRRRQTRQA